MVFLETERLRIRKFRDSDFEDFYEYAADVEMSRMMGRDLITDRESARPTFQWLKDREPRGYALEWKETGRVIGNLAVTDPSSLVASMPETKQKTGKALSFSVSRFYQRRGVMTEALGGVIRQLFGPEQVDYINCGYFLFNTPSRLLQEKLGFVSLTTETFRENGEDVTAVEQILWNPIRLRYACPSDYDSVEAIMQQVHALHLGWRPDLFKAAETIYSRENFAGRCEAHQILAAEWDGEIVGHMTYCYRHTESDKALERTVLFVEDLAVKEGYRGLGIGTRLLSAARERARRDQLDGLELQVNARNTEAKAMSEKFGFTEKSINMELPERRGDSDGA